MVRPDYAVLLDVVEIRKDQTLVVEPLAKHNKLKDLLEAHEAKDRIGDFLDDWCLENSRQRDYWRRKAAEYRVQLNILERKNGYTDEQLT